MRHLLALVSFRIYPAKMGGQKGVALFYQYLEKHFDITIAASKDNAGENIIACLYPNKKSFLNFLPLQKLEKLVITKKIDLTIAEHSYTGWIALLLRRWTRKPFIIHSHNIEALRFKQMNRWWWNYYLRYERWIHQKADHNFFISKEDLQFALENFDLPPGKCSVVTYGVNQKGIKESVTKESLGFKSNEFVFLFNGTLDYIPNENAIDALLYHIDPILSERLSGYKIVITGNRARHQLIQKINKSQNFTYKGFVDHIENYYQAADLFLNPVSNDSGVKTKVIEAIAHNCTVISFKGGASGIEKALTGEKLITVANDDYKDFVQQIIIAINKKPSSTPQAFFDNYYWANIAAKAAKTIEEVIQQHA